MSTRWRLPRALLGAVTALVLLGACITPGSEDSSSGPSSSRSAPSSSAPSSPTPSSSTPEPTHEPRGKGARALVQDPGAATWRMISSPERAYTTEGALTPSPARAEHDEGIGYERGCQAPREMTTSPPSPCVVGDVSGETEVAVVGDSKMLQWLPAIDPIARAEGWRVTVLTKSACGLTLRGQYEECAAYNRAMLRHLTTPGQVPDLVLTSLGDHSTRALTEDLAANLDRLETAGAQVIPFADSPAPDKGKGGGNPGPVLPCVRAHPGDWSSCHYPRNDGRGTESLEGAASRLDDAEVIKINRWICPTERCPAAVGGVLAYRQGTHLTATYVRSLVPALHRALIDAGHASAAPLS